MTCVLIIFGPIAANLALLTLWATTARRRPVPGHPQPYHPAPAVTVPPPAQRPAPVLPAYSPPPARVPEPVLSLGPIGRTVPPFTTTPTVPAVRPAPVHQEPRP